MMGRDGMGVSQRIHRHSVCAGTGRKDSGMSDFAALPMGERHFAVLFPGDAHRSCWGTGEKKKKVVIKVLA